jgi:hypothetical protein
MNYQKRWKMISYYKTKERWYCAEVKGNNMVEKQDEFILDYGVKHCTEVYEEIHPLVVIEMSSEILGKQIN